MLRRRMLSQMPFPPSGNVNDAYFYVEAPWIKDLSKYNMNVDESMYMDIDKYNGKYVFSMGRVGAYNSYIKFDNDSNILPCPQPDNEISIEALLYLNTQQEGRYWVHVMASWRNGYLKEYIGGVLSYEDATNVMYTQNYQTYYFNIGGYPSAYDMGLPGMFRYVRIWNYAKNFDLDKFVPDT